MQKKRLIGLLLLCSLIFIISGCVAPNENAITLKLGGFPYITKEYRLEILAIKGNEILSKQEFKGIDADDKLKKRIAVDKGAETLLLALYHQDNYTGEPNYFMLVPLQAGVTTYSNYYWVNFFIYTQYKTVDYGVSKTMLQDIALNSTVELDFNEAPYYVFKVASPKQQLIPITFSNENVVISYASSFPEYSFTGSTSNKVFLGYYQYDDLYICLKPRTYDTEEAYPKGTLAVGEANSLTFTSFGPAVPGANPNRMFAMDNFSKKVMMFDPKLRTLVNSFASPVEQVSQMVYSSQDNKLYLAADQQTVGVVDIATGTSSTFKQSLYIKQFDVQAAKRKMYVFGVGFPSDEMSKLSIYDLDTHQLLKEIMLEAYNVVFDTQNEKAYFRKPDPSGVAISRYSLTGDLPVEEQSTLVTGSTLPPLLTSDGKKLLIAYRPSFSSSTYNLRVYNAADLTEVLADFELSGTPSSMAIAPNGSQLYVINDDFGNNTIKVFDLTTYTQTGELDYFKTGTYHRLYFNNDGSVLLVSSGQRVCYYDLTTEVQSAEVSGFQRCLVRELSQVSQFIKESN